MKRDIAELELVKLALRHNKNKSALYALEVLPSSISFYEWVESYSLTKIVIQGDVLWFNGTPRELHKKLFTSIPRRRSIREWCRDVFVLKARHEDRF